MSEPSTCFITFLPIFGTSRKCVDVALDLQYAIALFTEFSGATQNEALVPLKVYI